MPLDEPWEHLAQLIAGRMFIGPSTSAAPLEVGVVFDDDGVAIIHAMRARKKFLTGWWTP